jgi:hypothetical protein
LRNTGPDPVHRILGEIESFNPLINSREMVFGRINPGQEVMSELLIKVPTEIINFKEDATLNVYSQESEKTPFKKMISTQFIEKTSPHLAYSYKMFDGGRTGTNGNGNGIPEKGEKLAMEVTVKNLGPGISQKTIVNLQNTEGDHVFLSKARAALGVLKTGEQAVAELDFEVKASFDKDEFNIKFFAVDDETKTSILDTLTFNSKTEPKADPKTGELQITPRIEVSAATAQFKDKYKIVATVLDEARLKDISIFVKGRKLYYDNLQTPDQAIKSKVINVDVPLEEGLNSIVIQARGARDLINLKNISVVYHNETKVVTVK